MTAFQKKFFAVFLAFAMMVPSTSFVYAEDTATMCQNHLQHDESCGYVAPSEGSPCTFVHEHDESCGYAEPSEGSPCTFVHEHDESCGYAEPSEGSPCTFVHEHDESCGYDETTEEGCTFVHEHNESCGYAAPSEGSPCTFVHEHDETCGYVAPSEGSPCTFVHEHDEYCGYAEPSEGSPCTHTCDLCNPMVAVENTEPEEDTNLSQVTTNTLLTPTPSTRSSYTSEDFSTKYTITDSTGQIVTSLNTTDLYTVTITGVPDGYALKNENGEEFISFGISKTTATDADTLESTWVSIGGPEKQTNGDWVLENFRLNNNMTGKGRFMTWFDGANVLGYSAVYDITASEASSDVKITNICYERLSGGSNYSFELYSEAFGLLEDKSTGTDYETFIRIYTSNNETGSPCDVTDLFELENTTFYAEDARGDKYALEHNFVLMGGSVQESYIDIKLSPLYIGNDKGITFSMPTDWTNPDRDKLIVSKVEVYVNGTLSRRVTMSDGRPGEEPSSRIFSLDMSMPNTSPTYALNGRFEKDVVVSLAVLYPNGIGATIYNGTAEIEISSETAFQLNGAGTAATSHTVKIPITGGSGSFRVISATTGGDNPFISGGTKFTVEATLVQKAGEQYDVTEKTGSFTLSGEKQYTEYTGTLYAEKNEGVAINITMGNDVTSAVTDTEGKFTFFAESGLTEVDVIRVARQGENGFYLYYQPVKENTLTIKLESVKIPIDLKWITHNEADGNTIKTSFSKEDLDSVLFKFYQNSRLLSWEIEENEGQYSFVLEDVANLQDTDRFNFTYKVPNHNYVYVYPKGADIQQGFTLEKEFPKAGSITAKFANGINKNDYAVNIYLKLDNTDNPRYHRESIDEVYNPSSISSYGKYRVVFSKRLTSYYLYESDFKEGMDSSTLYYEEVTGGLGIHETVTLEKELQGSEVFDIYSNTGSGVYYDSEFQRYRQYVYTSITDKSANLFGRVLRFDISDSLGFIPDENGENTIEMVYGVNKRIKIKVTKAEDGSYISEPLPQAEDQDKKYDIRVTITLKRINEDEGRVAGYAESLTEDYYTPLFYSNFKAKEITIEASPIVYGNELKYSLAANYNMIAGQSETIIISEKDNKFKQFEYEWQGYATVQPTYGLMTQKLEWNITPQEGEELTLCSKVKGSTSEPVASKVVTYTSQKPPIENLIEHLKISEISSTGKLIQDYYVIDEGVSQDRVNNIYYNTDIAEKEFEAKIYLSALPEDKEIYSIAVVGCVKGTAGSEHSNNFTIYLEPTDDPSIWTKTMETDPPGDRRVPAHNYTLIYSLCPKIELSEETDTAIDFDYEEYQTDLETLSDRFGQSVTSIEQQSGNNANGYDYSGFETTVNIGEIGETEVTMYSSSVEFVDSPQAFYTGENVYRGNATMADGEVVEVVSRVQLFRCDDPDNPNPSNMKELTDFDVDSIREFYQDGIKPETIFVQYVTSSVMKDGKYYDFDTYCNEASAQGDSGRSVFLASARNGASNGKFVGKGGGVKPKSDQSGDLQEFGSQTAITFTSDAVQGAVETGRFVDRFSAGAGVFTGALSGIGHSMEFGPVINDIENCIARARNVRDRYGEYLTDAEIQTLNHNISNMEYYLGVTKAGFAGAIGTDVAGVGIGLGAAALAPAIGGGSVAAGFALNGNVTLGAFASEQIMKSNYNRVMGLDAYTFNLLKNVTARRQESAPPINDSPLSASDFPLPMDDMVYDAGNSGDRYVGVVNQNRKIRVKYDPQGTVYDQDGNPVEDATMTVYFSKNADGSGAVAWVNEGEPNDAGDAAYAEIERPWLWGEPGVQETNAVGFYAWDVPDGYYYQVVAEKDGYTTAKSDWLRVIPPRFGVDLVMTNLNAGGDDDDDENNNTGTGGGGGGGGSVSVSYGISVSDDIANGKLTVSDKRAKKGDTVTITTAPDDGYALDTVTVKDEKGKEIKLTDLGNGKFSFTMPDSKITIDAQFVEKTDEIPVVVNPFADVKEGDWFYNDVMYVYSKGIMSGTGEKTFEPNTTTNRAMFVAVAWRLENMPVPKNTVAFTDVEKGTWYTDAAAWAYENGIASGFGDGTFGPNESITREQLAVFLYKYAQYKGYDLTITGNIDSFIDKDSVSPWAKDAVLWAVQNGFIAGKDGNKLDPKGFATRAEFAAIIHRFIEKMG
ncbi:S-layer homology domain-containing protein [Anaerotignum lactatifermentans]|uniref:S-layer homology domain-containing protein n=1 Tax=Anaerotignum lactatifermentans TaxID=160404 RepID=UPI00255C469B|nr:S-layer homology domain-containing protein [Anaerotignum lactatifermentans]